MSSSDSLLEEQVKEIIAHYKSKKATTYEPCTEYNYVKCLIALHEELSLLDISYVFNPFTDLEDDKLAPGALVNLINAVWTLLQHHKRTSEKASGLSERNHTLEQNNTYLNNLVERLKREAIKSEQEARSCISVASQAADRAGSLVRDLTEARARCLRIQKQKDASERNLKAEICRLKNECDKLKDKFRDKCGTFLSSNDATAAAVEDLRARNKKLKEMNLTLQQNNRQLLDQLLALKDELLLAGGLNELNLHEDKD